MQSIKSKTNLKVFPTTFHKELSYETDMDIKQISVYHLNGNKIHSFDVFNNNGVLDLSKLKEGNYYVTFLFTDDTKTIRKIEKKGK